MGEALMGGYILMYMGGGGGGTYIAWATMPFIYNISWSGRVEGYGGGYVIGGRTDIWRQ